MRYDGGGVGHRSTRDATQGASTTDRLDDPEESNEEAEPTGDSDADGEIDENDLYDWGYANENENDDAHGVETEAPATVDQEPIDEYDEEGYAPL